MEDTNTSEEIKENLTAQYAVLNPAELKRRIKTRQDLLYRAYQKKQQRRIESILKVDHCKKLTPRSSLFLIAEPAEFRQEMLIA